MTTRFEAIIIGAGHNGLVCAAYLARAGIQPLVLEARSSVGGCASTVDALGARVNVGNGDHLFFPQTGIADELDLAHHGLRYLDVDPVRISVPWDRTPAWPIFRDTDRTLEAIALTHRRELVNYRRYLDVAIPVARLVMAAANTVPSRSTLLSEVLTTRGRGVPTLLSWNRMSAGRVLQSFFDSDAITAPAVTTGPALWGLSPWTPRTGLGALSLAMNHLAPVGRPVGGSGALTDAIAAAARVAGATIYCDARVEAITCEGARVTGVKLVDGRRIEAPIVVSAVDPKTTFVHWLKNPPPRALAMVDRWREQPAAQGFVSKIDAVVEAPPVLATLDPALPDRLGFDPTHSTVVICPSLNEIDRAHKLMAKGQVVAQPVFFSNTPSALDPSLRPPGDGQLFSLEVLFTPYHLKGGWPASAEPQRWLKAFGELVQGGFVEGVKQWRAMTPNRYETDFNLPQGHPAGFVGGPVAAFIGQPRELTRYRTPIEGLYLTGAATFPGAGVWGASGRNTASVVANDTHRGESG